MNRTFLLALFFATVAAPLVAAAQLPIGLQLTTDRVEFALLPAVRYGSGGYVMHCRHAREGCEARIRRYAGAFVEAGTAEGVDPFLLAAVAFAESGLNPDAVGHGGERTIMQINPSSPSYRAVALACDRHGEPVCTATAVRTAARILAGVTARCGGVAGALQAYNSGDCSGSAPYAARVMRLRDRFLAASTPPAAQ